MFHKYTRLQQTIGQVDFILTIVSIILLFPVKVQGFTSQFPLSHFFTAFLLPDDTNRLTLQRNVTCERPEQ